MVNSRKKENVISKTRTRNFLNYFIHNGIFYYYKCEKFFNL